MTEDDTFNQLRKVSYNEMLRIWDTYLDNPINLTNSNEEYNDIFAKAGWTRSEFMNEYNIWRDE